MGSFGCTYGRTPAGPSASKGMVSDEEVRGGPYSWWARWLSTAHLDEHRPKNLSKLARFSVQGAAWISPTVRAWRSTA